MRFVVGTVGIDTVPARGEADGGLEVVAEYGWDAVYVLLIAACEENGLIGFVARVLGSAGVAVSLDHGYVENEVQKRRIYKPSV